MAAPSIEISNQILKNLLDLHSSHFIDFFIFINFIGD